MNVSEIFHIVITVRIFFNSCVSCVTVTHLSIFDDYSITLQLRLNFDRLQCMFFFFSELGLNCVEMEV